MDPDIRPLVIDNGSGYVKCGFSGENNPLGIFPSVVGRVRNPGILMMNVRDCYVGDEAQAKRGILRLKYPIEHGMITNWNDMEKIWHHTFYNELRVCPEESAVLLSEAPLNPKINRERMTSIMFETFNVPALCVMNTAVLSLFSVGLTNGLSVDVGDGVSHISPIYEGQVINRAIRRMNLGGRDVTDYFVKILEERGYEMTTRAEREIVRDIKEKLCWSSLDYEEDLTKSEMSTEFEKEYELPDGSKMTIGNELFRSPEIFFKPSLIGSELGGIHRQIFDSVSKLPKDEEDFSIRKLMLGNICVSGGSSKFGGFLDRMKKEIVRLKENDVESKCDVECGILAPERREYSAWTGGSIFSSLSWFVKNKYILKDAYDDCGPTIVHRVCC